LYFASDELTSLPHSITTKVLRSPPQMQSSGELHFKHKLYTASAHYARCRR